MAVLDDLNGQKKKPSSVGEGVANYQEPPAEAWKSTKAMGDYMHNNPPAFDKKIEPEFAPQLQPTELRQAETSDQTKARWEQQTNPLEGVTSAAEILERLSKPKEPTAAELEKEQKREQTRARILAVADAVSAIGEMAAVSKGAVPSTPLNLSGPSMARYEQRLAARQQARDAYNAKLEKATLSDLAYQQKADLELRGQIFTLQRDENKARRDATEAAKNRDWKAKQDADAQAETERLKKEELEFREREGNKNRGVQWGRINASNQPKPDKNQDKIDHLNIVIQRADQEIAEAKKMDDTAKIAAAQNRKDDALRNIYYIEESAKRNQPQPTAQAVGDDDLEILPYLEPSYRVSWSQNE